VAAMLVHSLVEFCTQLNFCTESSDFKLSSTWYSIFFTFDTHGQESVADDLISELGSGFYVVLCDVLHITSNVSVFKFFLSTDLKLMV
jgi:hypothetical protein